MTIKTKSAIITALATPLFIVAGATGASAAAPDDGCARGFESWDIDEERDFAYPAATRTDGNADGYVCARALGEGVSTSVGVPFTVYVFTDNDLPASSVG